MEVFKTTDYHIFKIDAKKNRPITGRVITDSVRKKNLLPEKPILVTKDYVVLDGQHRLKAAQELNLEIYYTFSRDDVTNADLASLNTQVPWKLIDYMKLNEEPGNDYEFFSVIIKEFRLETSLSKVIDFISTGSKANELFREGKLKLRFSREECYLRMKKVIELRDCLLHNLGLSVLDFASKDLAALWSITTHSRYDHRVAINKFSNPAYKDKIKQAFSWKDTKNKHDDLAKIYNFRRQHKESINFN